MILPFAESQTEICFELLMSIIGEHTQVHHKIDGVEHLLEVGFG